VCLLYTQCRQHVGQSDQISPGVTESLANTESSRYSDRRKRYFIAQKNIMPKPASINSDSNFVTTIKQLVVLVVELLLVVLVK